MLLVVLLVQINGLKDRGLLSKSLLIIAQNEPHLSSAVVVLVGLDQVHTILAAVIAKLQKKAK